ncbi:MAG: short-chain dehydrogenase [Novosphingobium sp. 28-62-57]|uniref:SDR family NAD(P)-dependent oxidoreductase n=1 Tax=unclassified Novosphingobium TaxID=2644732 RepID=UPI000BCBB989|nr:MULTISPECIES: SDR family oxidoreductase [unclassified Novosphingobium]OYW51508.1 MAG: short-chain dehydrogenase [Novosphingobium sp. 12-62-10]OYZ10606.1 MAG: short-chain dehydrogenase [Novosphingobium sp. 28-62-57]OZA40650.1 MAG: short-chain dehydrogenase [Novosphingobium sp. 17-62-9]HQS68135.1 SDR family oxidoreductase [Novosphingobium sp.]
MAQAPARSEPVVRRWLVTGASRGIGHAIAALACERGDKVCLVGRSADIADVAQELGENAIGIAADVTRREDMVRLASDIGARWGGIDVLVNNAGLHRGGTIDRFSDEDWEATLATNLSGPMRMIRALVPLMPPGSAVVNVGAVVGFRGFPGDSCYGASKAGLHGLTQVLAAELARKQVRVNMVVPGFVMTEMTSTISERASKAIVNRIPLQRMGRPEEIADVCWWVAGSTYMTGSVVFTDGGLMCNL